MTDEKRRGMEVRRAVLGNAYVDRAEASRTPLTDEFQDLITRYVWGEIWTRPALDQHTRICITVDELKEILLQTAIYCGVPAANSAFGVAATVLAETG